MLIEINLIKKNLNIFYWFSFKPIYHYLNFFILCLYALGWHDISWEAELIMMELTLFQISKKTILS